MIKTKLFGLSNNCVEQSTLAKIATVRGRLGKPEILINEVFNLDNLHSKVPGELSGFFGFVLWVNGADSQNGNNIFTKGVHSDL